MSDNVLWFSAAQVIAQTQAYRSTPSVLWMHVISNAILALVFFAIPFVLVYITRRRRDLRFDSLIACGSVFVVACGLIHVAQIWNAWHTHYWIESAIRVFAALASLPTAFLLWRSLPTIVSLPSQSQLRHANESLARANRELEAFTASVSHDLSSPLTTIAGQAGLLELSIGTHATDDQKRRLHRIQASVKNMSELIDALLVLSRISRHTLHRETVDVSTLSEHIIADLRQKQPERNVQVTIEPGLHVHGDRRLLSDLFANLLGNAWKFTSKTSEARIEVGQLRGGPMATLYIRDNGAGFDMAYEQKLFKPFQRLHGAAEFEGSGVGLATVARIVERHGGRIWAEGRPNAGATFHVTLPTAPITDMILVNTDAIGTSHSRQGASVG